MTVVRSRWVKMFHGSQLRSEYARGNVVAIRFQEQSFGRLIILHVSYLKAFSWKVY